VSTLDKNDSAAFLLKRIFRSIVWSIARAVLLVPVLATAQTVNAEDRPALEAQKEALFQQMFRDPANLDVTFAYADVSARLGDYEAAVSALERLLLFNPDLPRVQLELGALYFRMGSYELARDYFDKAAGQSAARSSCARRAIPG
jgi:tetratricopeptide (TPR) repeat protein